MRQLLKQQESQLAEQQQQLAAQQEAQREQLLTIEREHLAQQDSQRARQLELEHTRQRLLSVQEAQLEKTEIVLEQQRNYLDAQEPAELFDIQCNVVPICGNVGGGAVDLVNRRPVAVELFSRDAANDDGAHSIFGGGGFFSAET
jgi:hypothetical protein